MIVSFWFQMSVQEDMILYSILSVVERFDLENSVQNTLHPGNSNLLSIIYLFIYWLILPSG